MQPIIIQDTREQEPLRIEGYPVEVGTLPVGDYGIRGFSDWNNPAFIIERKTLDDLIGSLTQGRARFMREIEKMRQFRFRGLLIEAECSDVSNHSYRSQAAPAAILASLDALCVRAGIHIFWCGDTTGAARQLEGLVRQFIRGIEKDYGRLQPAA